MESFKKMLLVDHVMQNELRNIFSYITTPILFDGENADLLKKTYDIKYVSTFDHWLDEAECDRETMCFSSFIENNDTEYLNKEERFVSFYADLFDEGVYSWEENENFSLIYFKEYQNKFEYTKLSLESIREIKFINIFIPSLHAIVCGGYDLTQKILIKKGKDFKELDRIIKKNNLHTLIK